MERQTPMEALKAEIKKIRDSVAKILQNERANDILKSFDEYGYNIESLLETSSDNVNSPSHYTFGDIEVIDYIQDKLSPEAFEGYCIGNVMKYISRYRYKGGYEDLKKAVWYLNKAIEVGEKKNA